MITLDASVMIAHLNPHKPHHQAADAYLRDSAGEQLRMHSLNLAEVLIGGVKAGRARRRSPTGTPRYPRRRPSIGMPQVQT